MTSVGPHPLTRTGHHLARDFSRIPLNIYWEMTQACSLACTHCRAEALALAHPNELTHAESLEFLRQIPEFGDPLPHLILTGGDPLQRQDLLSLIDEARRLGIGLSITPAATPRLTHAVLAALRDHGMQGLGLSLDGATVRAHESIRGVAGCFEITMNAMQWAGQLDMPLQVNTLVAAETVDDLPRVYDLLKTRPVTRWSLFFLIAVGRGKILQPLAPARAEQLMEWVYDIAADAPFMIGTTEAPSYRRVALQRSHERALTPGGAARSGLRGPMQGGFPVRDGHGIVFVSNTGDICPAGFLPLVAGNVRTDRVAHVYREAPLFRDLHDPDTFKGRCGRCEYRKVCGGSRARAFAATGDALETDPLCSYEPTLSAPVGA